MPTPPLPTSSQGIPKAETDCPQDGDVAYKDLVSGFSGYGFDQPASAEVDAAMTGFDEFLQSKLSQLRVSILREIQLTRPSDQVCRELDREPAAGIEDPNSQNEASAHTAVATGGLIIACEEKLFEAHNPQVRIHESKVHSDEKPEVRTDEVTSAGEEIQPSAHNDVAITSTSALGGSDAIVAESERCPLDSEPCPLERSQNSAYRVKMKGKKLTVVVDDGSDSEPVLASICTARGIWESLMTGVVVVNVLMMAVAVQIRGSGIGRGLKNGGYIQHDVTADAVFSVLEYVFVVAYTMDLLVGLIVERSQWPKQWWNWLDFVVVLATYADLFFSSVHVNASTLKILRLGRFLRLAKLRKLVVKFEVCFILGRSLIKSCSALLWSAVFIFVFIIVSALIVSQGLSTFLENGNVPVGQRMAVYEAFGTFSRAVLTMFEVTLGNWGPPTWTLVDNVHESFMIFFILYKITAGFAALNVINAVFLRQTMKCSDEIDCFNIEQKQKAHGAYMEKLSEIFEEMDASGDGSVDFDEFESLIQSPAVVAWLALLDISVRDAEQLFHTLDGGDGLIDLKEWLKGIPRIKGAAAAADMMSVMATLSRLETRVAAIHAVVKPGSRGT